MSYIIATNRWIDLTRRLPQCLFIKLPELHSSTLCPSSQPCLLLNNGILVVTEHTEHRTTTGRTSKVRNFVSFLFHRVVFRGEGIHFFWWIWNFELSIYLFCQNKHDFHHISHQMPSNKLRVLLLFCQKLSYFQATRRNATKRGSGSFTTRGARAKKKGKGGKTNLRSKIRIPHHKCRYQTGFPSIIQSKLWEQAWQNS